MTISAVSHDLALSQGHMVTYRTNQAHALTAHKCGIGEHDLPPCRVLQPKIRRTAFAAPQKAKLESEKN